METLLDYALLVPLKILCMTVSISFSAAFAILVIGGAIGILFEKASKNE